MADKTLYWVKFIDQRTANPVDTYFLATGLKQLEEAISDIRSIKVISDIQDLTNPAPTTGEGE
jgi:hypothetical protein